MVKGKQLIQIRNGPILVETRDVPDHNRTKIGRIRFLIYFGSTMSGMHLASGNVEKFS